MADYGAVRATTFFREVQCCQQHALRMLCALATRATLTPPWYPAKSNTVLAAAGKNETTSSTTACAFLAARVLLLCLQARVRWLQVLRAAQKPAGGGWDLDFDADCEWRWGPVPGCADTRTARLHVANVGEHACVRVSVTVLPWLQLCAVNMTGAREQV